MNDKQYKQRTKVIGFPVVGYGDSIWPEIELKKYQLIENMLLAAMKGMDNCLFEEGDMSLRKQEDGSFAVDLRPIGITRSAVGILGGTYFEAPPSLRWDGLLTGKIYYLYLTKTPKTLLDPSSVRTFTAEYKKEARACILMGVVDLRTDKPILERYPDDKLYTSDLGKHLTDNDNPHGDSVQQKELTITKKISFSEDAEISVGGQTMLVSELLAKIACIKT